MSFYIQVVWNREFDWTSYGGGYSSQEAAESAARALMNSGDGARVKKARVVNDNGDVVVPWVRG